VGGFHFEVNQAFEIARHKEISLPDGSMRGPAVPCAGLLSSVQLSAILCILLPWRVKQRRQQASASINDAAQQKVELVRLGVLAILELRCSKTFLRAVG
jgi:hypothetical protein